MPEEIAAALREQSRRVAGIAEKLGTDDVRHELAAVASVLAQLAEKLERKRRRI